MTSSMKRKAENGKNGSATDTTGNNRVRFETAASTSNGDNKDERMQQDQQPHPAKRNKRPRTDRPNPDEEDDVDDWEEDHDNDEEPVVSSKQLHDAKRARRLQRHAASGFSEEHNENGEETVDASTSLMAEQQQHNGGADKTDDQNFIPVEPFNMDQERTDGSGYFDGDTYVFRKRDADEEPDAWLESLEQTKGPQKKSNETSKNSDEEDNDGNDDPNNLDNWSREQLYARLVPLLSNDNRETVMKALVRYGNLLKEKTSNGISQKAFNDLTEASNALLLKGDVDIYQKTRKDLVKDLPPPKNKNGEKKTVQWEYKGNQDGQIHGPYTTDQMRSWIQAGYFIGAQAVQIRTLTTDATESATSEQGKSSVVDDLLSDLMDDDTDNDEGKKENGDTSKQPEQTRGEWASSNHVDFSAFL